MEKKQERTISENGLSIGLPRAMLYYRYEKLWETFFSTLGIRQIVSEPTTKAMLEEGIKYAMDESCLATKIFLGHVQALIGTCDYILIPRISNFGQQRSMCTKFEALYDLTANIFRDTGQKFLSCNIDEKHKQSEEKAMTEMAISLGYQRKAVSSAYKKAKKEEKEDLKEKVRQQELLYKSSQIKILVCGHSYMLEDAYVGKPIFKMLRKMDTLPIRADLTERKSALEQSLKMSPTLKWEINREIVGSVYKNQEKVDGILLTSGFPCGPDSMVNEMIMRKNKEIPILNLVIDGQDGIAGMETRLESFVDIIRFKKGLM
jgi:predicted nucleotide-binding protein (sugar kinase/HSP70/actin superfamily)